MYHVYRYIHIQFYFFCVLSFIKFEKQGRLSVITKIGRKIRDVKYIKHKLLRVLWDVILLWDVMLQQHCPYSELILLQDYAFSRKHHSCVL